MVRKFFAIAIVTAGVGTGLLTFADERKVEDNRRAPLDVPSLVSTVKDPHKDVLKDALTGRGVARSTCFECHLPQQLKLDPHREFLTKTLLGEAAESKDCFTCHSNQKGVHADRMQRIEKLKRELRSLRSDDAR